MNMNEVLLERLASADSIAILTGAGVSAESGLGTFRGAGGLWNTVRVEDYATPDAFARRPAVVWDWYAERWRRMRVAEPNPAHRAIARLQELFASCLVVTQNIDGLHQKAGSTSVLELHGGLRWARCNRCGDRQSMDDAIAVAVSPPPCPCGGSYRPDVVWFGEMLPAGAFESALRACAECGAFFAVGTSGTVMPAAGLIGEAAAAGAVVVEINLEPSALSEYAHARLLGPAGEVLPPLVEELARVCQEKDV
jgi:NAD-dependent deacetylase